MNIEVAYTPALEEAIKFAPNDVTDHLETTSFARQIIENWQSADYQPPFDGHTPTSEVPSFRVLYKRTSELIRKDVPEPEKALDSLNRYLLHHATAIAQSAMLYQFDERTSSATPDEINTNTSKHFSKLEATRAIAGYHLLRVLTIPDTEEEFQARHESAVQLHSITNEAISQFEEHVKGLFKSNKGIIDAAKLLISEANIDGGLEDFIEKTVSKARSDFQLSPNLPAIRFMTGIYVKVDQYCRDHNLVNPLLNLTLGDVSGHAMPDHVAEAMGLLANGPKWNAIAARAGAIKTNMAEAGIVSDPERYDATALGWRGLRNEFIKYATDFGLYDRENSTASDKVSARESIIGSGGGETLKKAFTAAREYMTQVQKVEGTVEAYFSNPAFRWVAQQAKKAGLAVREERTIANDNFLPDLDKLDAFFGENRNCKIFVFTPINNPGANIAEGDYIRKLMQILRKHDVLLINDFAYLGTGDLEKNLDVGNAIRDYTKRIDVFSMSKIFGRPGLRGGCAITPMKEFVSKGEHEGKTYTFMRVGQDLQLSESSAMQATAIAVWQLVDANDRRRLAEHYRNQQTKFIKWLERINKNRLAHGKKALFKLDNSAKPIFGDAGLYIYAPLNTKEGVDAFMVLQEAGLVGTPGPGFYSDQFDDTYMRFALAVENIPDPDGSP